METFFLNFLDINIKILLSLWLIRHYLNIKDFYKIGETFCLGKILN